MNYFKWAFNTTIESLSQRAGQPASVFSTLLLSQMGEKGNIKQDSLPKANVKVGFPTKGQDIFLGGRAVSSQGHWLELLHPVILLALGDNGSTAGLNPKQDLPTDRVKCFPVFPLPCTVSSSQGCTEVGQVHRLAPGGTALGKSHRHGTPTTNHHFLQRSASFSFVPLFHAPRLPVGPPWVAVCPPLPGVPPTPAPPTDSPCWLREAPSSPAEPFLSPRQPHAHIPVYSQQAIQLAQPAAQAPLPVCIPCCRATGLAPFSVSIHFLQLPWLATPRFPPAALQLSSPVSATVTQGPQTPRPPGER